MRVRVFCKLKAIIIIGCGEATILDGQTTSMKVHQFIHRRA